MSRHRFIVIAGACALLAVPSVASAHPAKRGFAGTFPHAAVLCAKVEAGRAPARLASSAGQVKVACDTLHASFATARTDLKTAAGTLRPQARTAIATARAACRQARAAHDRPACRAAIKQARATLRDLRTQARGAAKAYRTAVQDARKAFWTSVRALAGGAAVTPDATVGADPAVALPSI